MIDAKAGPATKLGLKLLKVKKSGGSSWIPQIEAMSTAFRKVISASKTFPSLAGFMAINSGTVDRQQKDAFSALLQNKTECMFQLCLRAVC